MPSTHQKQLKRQWAQGKNNLEKAAYEVMRLKEEFESTHPDYAQLCDYVLASIFMTMQGWDAFAENAWGKLPINTLDWTA